MVPLVVWRRSPFVTCKRAVCVSRIVAERTTPTVVGVCPRQRVVRRELETTVHPLTEGEVYSVIVRAVDGLIVANACQHRLPRRRKRRRKGASTAASVHRHFLIDVDGLIPVKTENMRVFHFECGIRIYRPAVSPVELLRHGVAIVRVH